MNDFLKLKIILVNQQNNTIFLSAERLVNLERGRECFVGLSILYGGSLLGVEIVPFFNF